MATLDSRRANDATGIEYDATGHWATPERELWWCGRRPRTMAEVGASVQRGSGAGVVDSGGNGSVVRRTVGNGANGEQHEVAVKEFHDPGSDIVELVHELVARDLRHPNVAKIGGVATIRGRLAPVADLAAVDLRAFVDHQHIANGRSPDDVDHPEIPETAKHTPLTYDDARVIAYQLLRGMAYLQSMCISYPDLHGGNALVTEERIPGSDPPAIYHRILITDFGMAEPVGIRLRTTTSSRVLIEDHGSRAQRPTTSPVAWWLTRTTHFVGDALQAVFGAVTDQSTVPARARALLRSMPRGAVNRDGNYNAMSWLRSDIFCVDPLSDTSYVDCVSRRDPPPCTDDLTYAGNTPAAFVETVLPPEGCRPIRPLDVLADGRPSSDSIAWALCDGPGEAAGTPSRTTSGYPPKTTRGCAPTPAEYRSIALAILSERRRARASVHAMSLARRCAPVDFKRPQLARAFLHVAELTRFYVPLDAVAADRSAVESVLAALDYDVHHATAADHVAAYGRWSDFAGRPAAAAFVDGDEGMARLVELAMLDWAVAGAPAARVAGAIVAIVHRVFGVPEPWRPPHGEPTASTVAAAVVSGYTRAVGTGIAAPYAMIAPLLQSIAEVARKNT
jgi:hypothetical protein